MNKIYDHCIPRKQKTILQIHIVQWLNNFVFDLREDQNSGILAPCNKICSFFFCCNFLSGDFVCNFFVSIATSRQSGFSVSYHQ